MTKAKDGDTDQTRMRADARERIESMLQQKGSFIFTFFDGANLETIALLERTPTVRMEMLSEVARVLTQP